MTKYYKGQRIADLLEIIKEIESRLKLLTADTDPIHNPFSYAQYEEVAQGYTSHALAKAKLSALQGEK
jgi:hypothetical protein